MMVDGAEERQLKGPIDVLAPYSPSPMSRGRGLDDSTRIQRVDRLDEDPASRPTRRTSPRVLHRRLTKGSVGGTGSGSPRS